jgi:hypothetical protein
MTSKGVGPQAQDVNLPERTASQLTRACQMHANPFGDRTSGARAPHPFHLSTKRLPSDAATVAIVRRAIFLFQTDLPLRFI